MPIPWLALALAGAGAASAASSSMSASKDRKTQEKLSRDQLAFEESKLNPHRHQLNQLRSLISLNAARAMPRSATPLSPGGRYANAMPTMPATSYELDPEIAAASEELERAVLGGAEAPTVSGRNPTGFSLDLASRIAGSGRRGGGRGTGRTALKRGMLAR